MEDRRFRPGPVAAVSAAHLLHDVFSSFLAPILPLLIAKHGFSYTLAGLLSISQRLPSLVNPLVGLLADRLNLVVFLVAAPAVTSISMSLLGSAPGYPVLLLLCLTMGISSALFHVPAPVLIKTVSGDRVGRGMSLYMLGGEVARTLGPLVILTAVSLWGLEGSFRLIFIGVAASLMLLAVLRRLPAQLLSSATPANVPESAPVFRMGPVFVLLGAYILSRAMMRSALTTFLPTYMTANGATLWLGGGALAGLQLAGAAGTLLLGSLSDRWGRRNLLLLIAAASPPLMALFLLAPGVWKLPALVAAGLFLFGANPVMLALVQDRFPQRPAFANSIFMTISFVIGALGHLLIGTLGDLVGLSASYVVAAVLALAALPVAWRLRL